MATAHAHADDHHYTATGIDNRKLAIWTFIGSECMFFASLIGTYLVYKGRDVVGPKPHGEWLLNGVAQEQMLEIPLVTFGTALLLFSSFFVVLALNGAQKGNRKQLIGWLLATIVCGVFFVGMQVYEFNHFAHRGMGYTTNLFSSTFYTLTGFHGVHVTVGILMLLSLVGLSLRGTLGQDKAETVEIIGLYWHFVDIVWIIIFTVVYLTV